MSLESQFIEAIRLINLSIFDNGQKNRSRRGDALSCRLDADLVYIDPPYYSPLSDNEYVRRYHFVEGLACDWENVEIQWHTSTRKFKNYPTPFSSRKGAAGAACPPGVRGPTRHRLRPAPATRAAKGP